MPCVQQRFQTLRFLTAGFCFRFSDLRVTSSNVPDRWTSRRRRLGVLFLILAGSMLVLGQSWLEPVLRGKAFVYYWLACFAWTGLAMLMALIDIRVIRKRARQDHRQLVHGMVKEKPESHRREPP